MNLYQEEQVDYIMRTLTELEFLNGLKVEREILEESAEYEDGQTEKSRSPVKEEPIEEEEEEDEEMSAQKRGSAAKHYEYNLQ